MSNGINIVCYDLVTGKISASVFTQEENLYANVPPGEDYILNDEWPDAARFYVDLTTLTVIDRPEMPITVSALTFPVTSQLTVTGVPLGAIFYHPDGSNIINDGAIDWSTVSPDSYILRLELFPYIEEYWNVTVQA